MPTRMDIGVPPPTALEKEKDAAATFLRLAATGRTKDAFERFVGSGFRHHNPHFADDASTLRRGMEESHRQYPQTSIDIKRTIGDADLVAVHSHVRHRPEDPGIVVVHIFRFQDQRIVELWDLAQELPKDTPNRSGAF